MVEPTLCSRCGDPMTKGQEVWTLHGEPLIHIICPISIKEAKEHKLPLRMEGNPRMITGSCDHA